MTVTSTDLEAGIRAAIARRLQLARVPAVPAWDDEAVAAVLRTLAPAIEIMDALDTAERGKTVDLGSFAQHAGPGEDELRALASEMLASFRPGSNGWSARVKAEQAEQWRERLGEGG